uniref:Secreted protein n=1 Tax=Strongyloides venezuelensis TaxID=75913 RepID=A0A0K0F1U1_STRVS
MSRIINYLTFKSILVEVIAIEAIYWIIDLEVFGLFYASLFLRIRMEFPHTRDILSCIFEKCGKKFFLNKRDKMSRLLKVTFCRENIQDIKYP